MEHISYKQGRRRKGFVPYVSSDLFAVAHSHFERTAEVYSLRFFPTLALFGENHLENMIWYASTNLQGHAWYLFEVAVVCSSPKAFTFLLTLRVCYPAKRS